MDELLVSAPSDLKNFLRMDHNTYESLLSAVRPQIQKNDTFMRDAISANERLSATLRFLACGQSFEDLKFLTAISPQSLGVIVMETCSAIIKALKGYIEIPKTEEKWINIAESFSKRWNFPNCIGAIDGKHVEIRKPFNSGSYYFNYKKTFSIVLLAVVNANYEFIMVEVGANGRVSDGGVFTNSKFHEKLNTLAVPDTCVLPNTRTKVPFVFVGDDAFSLEPHMMKPYGGDNIGQEEQIFNYRLSRARRIVENVFGILSSRFRVLLSKINLSPQKAAIITLAACYLHNYLRKMNSTIYLRDSVDSENIVTGSLTDGAWRSEPRSMIPLEPTRAHNCKEAAKEVRNQLKDYFNGTGSVPWQSLNLK